MSRNVFRFLSAAVLLALATCVPSPDPITRLPAGVCITDAECEGLDPVPAQRG